MNVVTGLVTATILLGVLLLFIGGIAGFVEICREHRRLAHRWQTAAEDTLDPKS